MEREKMKIIISIETENKKSIEKVIKNFLRNVNHLARIQSHEVIVIEDEKAKVNKKALHNKA